MLDLCLNTTYFQYREGFYRQKHGWTMGSPVSPIVANLNMEEVERKALMSFLETVPNPLVQIQTKELEAFPAHLNKTDKDVKFRHKNVKENNIGPKKYPPQPRGQRRNRNASKQHWEHVATQTGPSAKPPENENPRKKGIEKNVTTFPSRIYLEFRKNLGEKTRHSGEVQTLHTKAQTEQRCLCHTVPGRTQYTAHWGNETAHP